MGPFPLSPRPRRSLQVGGGVLAFLLFITTFCSAAPAAAQETEEAYYIEDTGHRLGGPFLNYWILNDGLNRVGMPVSEVIASQNGERQYFEYGVLEYTPTSDEVFVEDAGRELLELRHDPFDLAAGKRAGAVREAGAFAKFGDATAVLPAPQTTTAAVQEWVAGLDETYDEGGGAERFGAPISDAYLGYGKVVRWYESGRVEVWHGVDAEAAIARVGKELALLSGVDTDEVSAGDLTSISGAALAAGNLGGTYAGTYGFAEAEGAFTPTRIVIPAIGVDAYIEQVGIYDGVMGTPAGPMNVGWYPAISSPGYGTNVVMAGHVDYYTVGPAVFYSLASLGVGNEIYVMGPDGTGFAYSVTGSIVVGAYEPAENVLGGPGGESLTLITCGGSFNGVAYDSRTILYAVRI
jgi:hypothetical protein